MSNPWPNCPLARLPAPDAANDVVVNVATTLPAAASQGPALLAIVGSAILFATASAAIVAIARWRGWFRDRRWTPPRCPTPASAMRLWIGAAAMMLVFLAPGLLLAGRAGTAATTAPAAPSARSDLLGLSLMTLVYLVGFAAVAIVHVRLGLPQALVALGLRSSPGRPSGSEGDRAPVVAAAVEPRPAGDRLDYAAPVVMDGIYVPPIRPVEGIALGAPFAVAITMCASALTQIAWVAIGYRHESAHELLQLMQRAEQVPMVLVAAVLNAVVLAPLFEELLFRGHLQTALASLTPGRRWPAIVLASACFALLHTAWMIPPIFVLSLVIGYLYERTGNLWVAVATHVAFNATSTGLFLLTR